MNLSNFYKLRKLNFINIYNFPYKDFCFKTQHNIILKYQYFDFDMDGKFLLQAKLFH